MTTTRDWRPLYPFQSREIMLDGHRCHYVDEGAGPVLLMVHGNPTWSFYWRELIKTFRDDYRVIAIDHIGCGLSEKPQKYPYTSAQHVANLTALIEHLDLQHIALVGHDWGGAIGMGAAQNVAERIDRLAMLKYGMPDLRAFFDGDKRWIDHYGFRAWDVPTLFGGLSSS